MKDELVYRTPGFTGWQSNYWWTHQGDAGVFIDYAGKDELLEYGPELIQQLKADSGMDDEEWDYVFQGMSKNGTVLAYVFQCRKTGKYGGYWDCC